MNEKQVVKLMSSSTNRKEWNDNREKVKEACGGDLPDYWVKAIILSSVTDNVIKKMRDNAIKKMETDERSEEG